MKKKFLLVSMIAAAMLTASCSKEDNGDNSEQPVNVEQQIVQNTRPIVIKVDKKTSLSKVGTSDGYVLTFSEGDKLVLTDGATQYAELNLQAGDEGKQTATFTGEISTEADGKEIYATVGSPLEGVQTSSESLADVVAKNCYLKSAAFTYSQETALNVELNDQNAYLVFSVSEGQKKVNIGGENDWYPTDGNIANQKLYVAVSAGEVSGRFFGTKTLDASKIYTITREDVVDLGPDFSVLWTTCNLGANNPGEYGYYYAYGETAGYAWGDGHNFSSRYTGTDNPLPAANDAATAYATTNNWGAGYRMPTDGECQTLANIKTNPKDGDEYTFEKNRGATFKTSYGSVFLPAAGYCGGTHRVLDGSNGYYWSSTPNGKSFAHCLNFYSGSADVVYDDCMCGQSVRAVRCMN